MTKNAKPANGESVKHTVAVGESLGVIARKYQVSVGELAAVNNITDPSKVRAGQQLVIPGFKGPEHFARSPLMGSAPLRRDVLLYFRGDVGLNREKWYSGGVRQTLFRCVCVAA